MNEKDRQLEWASVKRGFSLAEVLVALVVIGVLAALTIPTLIAASQKAGYVAGARKAYSDWNRALIQMAADGGCIGDLSCFFDSADLKTMGDKIAAYFNVAKNCDMTTSGCFPNTIARSFDGTNTVSGQDSTLYYRFITADGMSIFLATPYSGCSGSAASLTKVCMATFRIDVNGLKKPNAWGRDIYLFSIDNTNGPILYPIGGTKYWPWKNSGCTYGYNGGTDKNGLYCTGRIIDEGWQMNY
ncbi:MAG: type II secretion system protein [Candidatus Gastranaerophilaceae bacterium]